MIWGNYHADSSVCVFDLWGIVLNAVMDLYCRWVHVDQLHLKRTSVDFLKNPHCRNKSYMYRYESPMMAFLKKNKRLIFNASGTIYLWLETVCELWWGSPPSTYPAVSFVEPPRLEKILCDIVCCSLYCCSRGARRINS